MRRLALCVFIAGCVQPPDEIERRRPRIDAAVAPTDQGGGGDPTAANVVTCYSQGAPANTCTTPEYCCFNNYSADRNGFCTTTETCVYGTIYCDGPEDCGSGQRCCATAQRDPELGTTGYILGCRSGECGGPPLDYELCHPATNTCATGTCVSAYGTANDLPRTLYVCK